MRSIGEPLAGCVIVITADRRKRELGATLARRGATVWHAPARSTVAHLGVEGLRVAVQHHGDGSDGLEEAVTAAGADAVVRELVKHFSDSVVGVPPPDGPLVLGSTTAVLNGSVLALKRTVVKRGCASAVSVA
ncbi:hypothetical protein [Demequina sp.]|uniref:hypothetical protein n=1 Tax=Demequina sp. TaxID=2050685 RepID=UPI00344C09AB